MARHSTILLGFFLRFSLLCDRNGHILTNIWKYHWSERFSALKLKQKSWKWNKGFWFELKVDLSTRCLHPALTQIIRSTPDENSVPNANHSYNHSTTTKSPYTLTHIHRQGMNRQPHPPPESGPSLYFRKNILTWTGTTFFPSEKRLQWIENLSKINMLSETDDNPRRWHNCAWGSLHALRFGFLRACVHECDMFIGARTSARVGVRGGDMWNFNWGLLLSWPPIHLLRFYLNMMVTSKKDTAEHLSTD